MSTIFDRSEGVVLNTEPEEVSPETRAQLKSGANWFYWIAGLSLINSAIFIFGGNVNFIAGLAYTQLIDAIFDASVSQGAPSGIIAVAAVIDLVVVVVFALIGYFSNKAINAVFIGGMLIYAVDGVIWLLLGSLFAAGFHVFALVMIFRGFMASREINRINVENRALQA